MKIAGSKNGRGNGSGKRKKGWIRRLFSSSGGQEQRAVGKQIYTRDEHPISRKQMSRNAVKVLNRIHQGGYESYLVGGGVRDLMLEREPKDFDVATSATPEEVKGLFRNCRLIGRRFRLAHVHFGREIIEVATFRSGQDGSDQKAVQSEQGMILRDNEYGSLEEDAWRRDFTINALYYNIADFSVVDYTGGIEDLKQGQIRLIGDPDQRYQEDPVRMLRAVRFAVKLGFQIESVTEEPITRLAHLLEQIPQARLYEEFLKMFQAGQALETFERLRHYGLFKYLFPITDRVLDQQEGFPHNFLMRALENTDQRVAAGKPITPAFLIAALLWEEVRQQADRSQEKNPDSGQRLPENTRLHRAGHSVLREQRKSLSMPKRFAIMAQEIWELQPRFIRRRGRQPYRFMEHPRFRAAYDFMLLRAEVGECDTELAQWWTDFQKVGSNEREKMVNDAPGDGRPKKRRRRRRKKASASSD